MKSTKDFLSMRGSINTKKSYSDEEADRAVLDLVKKEDKLQVLESLRNTVIQYDKPTEPVAEEDWEAKKVQYHKYTDEDIDEFMKEDALPKELREKIMKK